MPQLNSTSSLSSTGCAAKLYAGGSCSWPSVKMSIVAACSRLPVSPSTSPERLAAAHDAAAEARLDDLVDQAPAVVAKE